MKAILITIGDEILSGNTVDTNSNFIAQQLRNIGIPVVKIITVADDVDIICDSLSQAFENADLVITTGGPALRKTTGPSLHLLNISVTN